MHLRKTILILLSAIAIVSLAYAQAPPAAPFMTHPLKPNIYWIEGGGGNSTVIVGDKAVIVVDAKTTPDQGKTNDGRGAGVSPSATCSWPRLAVSRSRR